MAVDLPTPLEDVMEHKTQDEIREVANILPSCLQPRPLSRRERLELWAETLEREGGRRLRTLYQIEYAPPAERARGRADDSPLSVAFNHPGLRAAGLGGVLSVTQGVRWAQTRSGQAPELTKLNLRSAAILPAVSGE